jgi:hypothetical protein
MPPRPLPPEYDDYAMQDAEQEGGATLGGDAEAEPGKSDEDLDEQKKRTLDEQEIASKDWNDCLAKLYTRMDEKFAKKNGVLKSLLGEHDTTKWMLEWSRIIEDSVIEITNQLPGVAKVLRGRGGTIVTSHKKPTESKTNAANHTTGRCQPTMEIRKTLIQARRCQAWADRLRLMTKSKLTDHQHTTFQCLNVQAAADMKEELNPADPEEAT